MFANSRCSPLAAPYSNLCINILQVALAMHSEEMWQEAMLKIQRSSSPGVVFSLSGRIEIEDVAELQRLFSLETVGQDIALDLQEVILVDRDAVTFLARCEAEKIKLENCPPYIREWIDGERRRSSRQEG
jgi:hypothetical protein